MMLSKAHSKPLMLVCMSFLCRNGLAGKKSKFRNYSVFPKYMNQHYQNENWRIGELDLTLNQTYYELSLVKTTL